MSKTPAMFINVLNPIPAKSCPGLKEPPTPRVPATARAMLAAMRRGKS